MLTGLIVAFALAPAALTYAAPLDALADFSFDGARPSLHPSDWRFRPKPGPSIGRTKEVPRKRARSWLIPPAGDTQVTVLFDRFIAASTPAVLEDVVDPAWRCLVGGWGGDLNRKISFALREVATPSAGPLFPGRLERKVRPVWENDADAPASLTNATEGPDFVIATGKERFCIRRDGEYLIFSALTPKYMAGSSALAAYGYCWKEPAPVSTGISDP